MKKTFYLIALPFVLAALSFHTANAETYWDGNVDIEWLGDGTANSPYLITTPQELAGLAKRTNDGETFNGIYFKLTDDIWLSNPASADEDKPLWTAIGERELFNSDDEENPGNFTKTERWFKGNFDGDGHTIHNLWYAHNSTFMEDFNDPFNMGGLDFTGWYRGLFGLLDGATVKNVNLAGTAIQVTAQGAGIAVEAINSTFSNISVAGAIVGGNGDEKEGGSAAGLVVEATNCSFTNCTSATNIAGTTFAAGLVGILRDGSITNCSSSGDILALNELGGLVATSEYSTIDASSSSANLTQKACRRPQVIGGFVGSVTGGEIRECFSTGNVYPHTSGAGFAGRVWYDGLIESCYSISDIITNDTGVNMASFIGMIGDVEIEGINVTKPGRVVNCYGAGSYSHVDPNPDVVGGYIFKYGFMIGQMEGAQIVNAFYNSDNTGEVNTISESDGTFHDFPNEFGLTTAYMQSQAFVDELNRMAGVAGTSLWQYNAGSYPTPTGVKATPSYALFNGGEGTADFPFLISNKEQLKRVADYTNHGWYFANQYLKQTDDIALNAPIELWGEQYPEQWTPIGRYYENNEKGGFRFAGTYDGNYHTVSNMYIDNDKSNYDGLFGVLGNNATIMNLGVTDAWITSNNSAILVGASNLHNDWYDGNRTIERCWVSGKIYGSYVASLVGYHCDCGKLLVNGCYALVDFTDSSNAEAFVKGGSSYNDMLISGSWFAGPFNKYASSPVYYSGNEYFWSFIDSNIVNIPINQLTSCTSLLRTTDYMHSRRFVNDLNYAAAATGFTAPWGYNQDSYPSFDGEKPTLNVTIDNGLDAPFTFKAFVSSELSEPSLPQREGYRVSGWFTDDKFTNIFDFGKNLLSSDITLYAKWEPTSEVDYSIFNNKFANTFTITTAAQLRGLAEVVAGRADGVNKNDFTGKTVKLGNDIALNDIDFYELWGNGMNPEVSPTIGVPFEDSSSFNGIFDGQGHTISGYYAKGGSIGLFGNLGTGSEIKNLNIDHAVLEPYSVSNEYVYAAILSVQTKGKVSKCSVKGKIIADPTVLRGYISGLVSSIAGSSNISECFADVEISVYNCNVGGLVCIAESPSSISDSYVRGNMTITNFASISDANMPGSFGGVVGSGAGSITNAYSDIKLDISGRPDGKCYYYNQGGAYGGYTYNSSIDNVYYCASGIGDAFDVFEKQQAEQAYNKGTALSDDQMSKMASFIGFDFNNVWGHRYDINAGMPYLRWVAPGLPNDEDNAVGIEDVIDNVQDYSTITDIFNLDGTKANSLVPGRIYICRQANGKYSKIVIK